MILKSKYFLFKYLNSNSPTGHEVAGQKLWLDYLRPYVETTLTDTYGTAVGVINPEADYKVVVEAHADEISWFVSYITPEGYIYVTRNGGSDYQIAPSHRAKIHTDQGMVPAIFGWPAIHVREDREKAVKLNKEKAILDCGCESADEVANLGIHVGCIVTFDAELMSLNKRFFTGRALDNRIGGFIIAEVARRLHESKKKLPFGLYIVNAVQEEVGHRGAEMIAARIRPDLAIVTDVTHDTQSPLYNKVKQGDVACGKGPVLTHAPSVQQNVLRMLVETARKQNIPFQRDVASRSTGTDTDAFAYAHTGIPSALISLPLKYMHTTVETVHEEDIEQVISLFYQFLLQLTPHHDFSYFK
ncbi:MAG: M20/M25/M40 family metallo-hydrolase [Bacteroidota bacterium]